MKNRLKILYVNSNSINNKTADIKQSVNAVNALSKLCDITYYSSWISKNNIKSLERFFDLKINFKHKKAFVAINTKFFAFEIITRLVFCMYLIIHLYFNKYDAVLTRDFSFLYLLGLIPQFLKPKVRIIFEAHKIYYKTSKKVVFNQEKKALSQAELFVANSDGTKKGLIELFGIPDNKILALHNGVDIVAFKKTNPRYNYLKNEYGIDKNNKIIIYSGSFLPWKGVEYLIEAFDCINIKNIKLLLVGGNPADIKRIENIAAKIKNKDKIIVRGFKAQEELIQLLCVSMIAVIPNNITNEGENYTSPVKAFEYLSMGLPIIASRLPAMKNILTEKENCLFFTPENAKDLAKKIEMLLNNEDLQKSMSKNNVIKSKNYSWDNRAKRLVNFILRHTK